MNGGPIYRSDEVREAWLACRDLKQSEIDGLLSPGVPRRALGQDGDGGGFALAAGRVRYEGWRFEFDSENGALSLICPLRDRAGDLADLAAFKPKTGDIGTWLGVCSLLGEQSIERARLGVPLACHETALEWLCNGREGIAIVNPDRARLALIGAGTLGVSNIGFGRRLENILTIKPAIAVAREALARRGAA
jgi:hypothetical protein